MIVGGNQGVDTLEVPESERDKSSLTEAQIIKLVGKAMLRTHSCADFAVVRRHFEPGHWTCHRNRWHAVPRFDCPKGVQHPRQAGT